MFRLVRLRSEASRAIGAPPYNDALQQRECHNRRAVASRPDLSASVPRQGNVLKYHESRADKQSKHNGPSKIMPPISSSCIRFNG